MKEAAPARFILVAVDASPHSLAALETAARVASRLHAELRGMYVEDIDLVRTAGLPFACAITSSGGAQPLTVDTIERQLHRQAEIARRAVESACAPLRVTWSFSVVRGAVLREIVRASSEAEMITVGRTGWSLRKGSRIGSVARSLLEKGTAPLLMVEKDGVDGPFGVVFDGSAAAHRALDLAAALAGSAGQPLSVLVVEGTAQDEQSAASDQLQHDGIKARLEPLTGDLPSALAERLRRQDIRTLLVPDSAFPEGLQASMVDRLSGSVLLVR